MSLNSNLPGELLSASDSVESPENLGR